MPDPIQDIKSGVPDAQLKKKYSLSDDDIFTLRKYDYATTKGGVSESDALELYPSLTKILSPKKEKTVEKPVSKDTNPYKGSMIPDIDFGKPAAESTGSLQASEGQKVLTNKESIGESFAQANKAQSDKQFQQDVADFKEKPQATISQMSAADTERTKQLSANQEEADKFYNTPGGKAYYNFLRPFWKATTEAGGKILGAGTRLGGNIANALGAPAARESGNEVADGLVNYFDFDRRSKEDRGDSKLYSTPTKLQGGLVNDGKVDAAKLIPNTVENLTNMAVLLGGGTAVGGKAGLFVSSYFNSVESYRKDAQAAGLRGGQLDAVSNILAGVTSALEELSPNEAITKGIKNSILKTAIRDIKDGTSVSSAIKRAVPLVLKENGKEVGQELLQNIGDHAIKAISDASLKNSRFDEDLSYKSIRDEVAETTLMTILPTTLLLGASNINRLNPSKNFKSALNYASGNQELFGNAVDKAVQAGTYTPQQAQTMKDNVARFSNIQEGIQKMGYSEDQSNRMAWSTYKDAKITDNAAAVKNNPILKETIGKEVEKDRDELKNDIQDAARGIPEVGTELSGDELVNIVKEVARTGPATIKKIEGNDFKVTEINLQEKFKDDPNFQKRVENFEKSKEDEEGLRMPAILDADGEVIDGNKRLLQQYVNGDKTARVFQQLKSPINESGTGNNEGDNRDISSQLDSFDSGISGKDAVVPEDSSNGLQNGNTQPRGNMEPISGINPEARDKIINQRKAKTNLSERQTKINRLLQDADQYDKLAKGRLGKEKSEGLQQLNDINLRAKELGLVYDASRNILKKEDTGGKVQKRFLAQSNQAIIDNHVDLNNRPPEVQQTFKALHSSIPEGVNPALFFPNDITGVDGKVLNDSQLNATLQDVFDGIPSVQAENYLNEFERMVKDGNVDLTNDGQKVSVPIDEYVQSITAAKADVDEQLDRGQLPDEDAIQKWLEENEKVILDPEFENLFNDDNLADNGSSQNTQTVTEEQTSTADTEQAQSSATGSESTNAVQQNGKERVLPQDKEQAAGLKPVDRTGRIKVDPIYNGDPKDLSKMILDLTRGLKQPLFFSKLKSNQAGTYAPSSGAVKIRFNGDLDTTAHEIGHAIDDKYDLITDILANPAATKELPQFSKYGSTPPKGISNPAKYEANEGFAEFLRAYILNPTETTAIAPEITKIYNAKVPASAKEVINEFSKEVRTWAGATGLQITQANIQLKAEDKPGFIKRLFEKKETNKGFEISWADNVAANFVNPMRVFDKAFEYVRDVKGVKNVDPADNPTLLARLLLGVDGKFGQVLKNGMIDGENNVLKDKDGNVKNLKWLLEPFNNVDQSTVEKDMNDTIAYMVSERTVELSKRFERDNILSGVGGGIFSDVEVAQKALDEINNGDPKRLAMIKEASDRYRELADDTMKYLVEKGRMAPTQYQQIKADNLQYVAMQRILETEPEMEVSVYKGSGGKLTSISEPVNRIKGSSKKIVNPYVSLIDTIHKSLKEGDRNEVLRAFRDMMTESRSMNSGPVKNFSDVGVIAKEGDKETTTIFKDGVPEKWKFNQDIYKALNSLDHDVYRLPNWIKIYASTVRSFTTQFPVFAARNWIRDIQQRLIATNDKSGFMDLFGNPEDWNEVERTGGLNAGYYTKSKEMYYTLMNQAITDVSKKKGFIVANPSRLKEVWHKYESALFKAETSNRVAEYRAAFRQGKKQGMDDYNASLYGAFKSRDMMDFAVAGHVMKMVNQIIPFTNAAVQGLRSAAVRIKENPAGFLARTVLFSVLPQVAVWMWNHYDDEAKEQYEDLPAYQRDMFWNLRLGPNNWLSLPKPYELSLLSSGVDRAMSSAIGNEKAFDGYGGTVAKSLIPVDEGSIFGPAKPAVELVANYDAFREKYIVSPYENNIDLSLRNTQTASRLGQLIQQAAGVDARKADYFITSTFSYPGKTALKLSDMGRETSGNKFNKTDLGIFKGSPGYNSAPVQEMMKFAAQWNLTLGKDYKRFTAMSKDYFAEKDDKQIEVKAKKLIEYSEMLMDKWENEGIIDRKKAKAEKRREKTK